jgi:hypothetical protein
MALTNMYNDVMDRLEHSNSQANNPAGTVAAVYSGDDEYASKTLANIKRAQWADYKAKFPAIQSQYLDMAMNPDFTLEQVDRVEGNVNQAYDRAEKNQQATLSRMGVADTSDKNDLAKSLSIAHGENSTRQHGADRQMNAIAGGSLPSLQTQTV